jgi:DNA-binding transcriptional MerR regulator
VPRLTFPFSDAARLAGVDRNRLTRWTDAGIIVPFQGGEGKGKQRGYDFRNLVDIMIVDRLRLLQVSEPIVKYVMAWLRESYAAYPAARPYLPDETLWINLKPTEVAEENAVPVLVPAVQFWAPKIVGAAIESGQFGIAIPLGPIIESLRAAGVKVQW